MGQARPYTKRTRTRQDKCRAALSHASHDNRALPRCEPRQGLTLAPAIVVNASLSFESPYNQKEKRRRKTSTKPTWPRPCRDGAWCRPWHHKYFATPPTPNLLHTSVTLSPKYSVYLIKWKKRRKKGESKGKREHTQPNAL